MKKIISGNRRKSAERKKSFPATAGSLRNEKNHFRQPPEVCKTKKIISGNRRKSAKRKKSFPATAGSLRNEENHFRQLPEGCKNTKKRL
jgi:hypothetical protein